MSSSQGPPLPGGAETFSKHARLAKHGEIEIASLRCCKSEYASYRHWEKEVAV